MEIRTIHRMLLVLVWTAIGWCEQQKTVHTTSVPKKHPPVDPLVDELRNLTLMQEGINKRIFEGWSAWSQWSACSKTCGMGVRHQLRTCLGHSCVGKSVKYELCNTEDCPPGSENFRQLQCAFYDARPYRGLYYDQWTAVNSTQDPCALVCKSAKYRYTVKMAPKVADGTRCTETSLTSRSDDDHLHVCVDGKCVLVGCDNIVGSGAIIDQCGVCGGDGRSCGALSKFVWQNTKIWSACDKTCGFNRWQVTVSHCLHAKDQKSVPEKYCADQPRPQPLIRRCPDSVCPEKLVGNFLFETFLTYLMLHMFLE